jgi:hypothetical protein
MVEIILSEVKMPPLNERPYRLVPLDCNGNKWSVVSNGAVTHKGGFENMTLIAHNLNKKYFQEHPWKG